MSINRLLLRFGIVFGLALIAGAAGVLYPVIVAKSLIRDVRTIEGQPISEAWLRQWAKERGGDYGCYDSGCQAGVEDYNWLLSKLRLARPALFMVNVTLKEGRLSRVDLTLTDLNYDAHPQGATTFTHVYYTKVDYSGSGRCERIASTGSISDENGVDRS